MAQHCQLTDHVLGLVFDTTASNTGWKIGTCVLLEKLLCKKLMMLACRHHFYERILSAVYRAIFGPTSGPDNADFEKFRDLHWKHINTESGFHVLQITNDSLLRRRDIIEVLKDILDSELPRDDYRECAEVMCLLLGETTARGMHWFRPGAANYAGWMPAVLYPAKMFAFSSWAGYDSSMIRKLNSLCLFNALF